MKPILINIKLDTAPGELGSYVKYIAEQNVCTNTVALRKIIKDAMELHDKKLLKNMPLFKK